MKKLRHLPLAHTAITDKTIGLYKAVSQTWLALSEAVAGIEEGKDRTEPHALFATYSAVALNSRTLNGKSARSVQDEDTPSHSRPFHEDLQWFAHALAQDHSRRYGRDLNVGTPCPSGLCQARAALAPAAKPLVLQQDQL
jgi:hypothetical protein